MGRFNHRSVSDGGRTCVSSIQLNGWLPPEIPDLAIPNTASNVTLDSPQRLPGQVDDSDPNYDPTQDINNARYESQDPPNSGDPVWDEFAEIYKETTGHYPHPGTGPCTDSELMDIGNSHEEYLKTLEEEYPTL